MQPTLPALCTPLKIGERAEFRQEAHGLHTGEKCGFILDAILLYTKCGAFLGYVYSGAEVSATVPPMERREPLVKSSVEKLSRKAQSKSDCRKATVEKRLALSESSLGELNAIQVGGNCEWFDIGGFRRGGCFAPL